MHGARGHFGLYSKQRLAEGKDKGLLIVFIDSNRRSVVLKASLCGIKSVRLTCTISFSHLVLCLLYGILCRTCCEINYIKNNNIKRCA